MAAGISCCIVYIPRLNSIVRPKIPTVVGQVHALNNTCNSDESRDAKSRMLGAQCAHMYHSRVRQVPYGPCSPKYIRTYQEMLFWRIDLVLRYCFKLCVFWYVRRVNESMILRMERYQELWSCIVCRVQGVRTRAPPEPSPHPLVSFPLSESNKLFG